MKRTFIPPQNRPSIRSAALRSESDSPHYLAVIADPRRRQKLIAELLDGQQSIPGLAPELVQKLLSGLNGQALRGVQGV